MVLDKNRADPKKRPQRFNFDNADKEKPLSDSRVWEGKWKQLNANNELVSIDLGKWKQIACATTAIVSAAKINAFYENESGRSLTDNALLDDRSQNVFVIN